MKNLILAASLVFSSVVMANDEIDLTKNPEEFSRLYLQLSDEERVELFEAQKRFMDDGGLIPDMTAACSRWVTIGTVIRQSVGTGMVQELYFDAN